MKRQEILYVFMLKHWIHLWILRCVPWWDCYYSINTESLRKWNVHKGPNYFEYNFPQNKFDDVLSTFPLFIKSGQIQTSWKSTELFILKFNKILHSINLQTDALGSYIFKCPIYHLLEVNNITESRLSHTTLTVNG